MSDRNPNQTPRVPDELHANTAHPFWRLLRIVEAARAVVRAIRRFFPVDDRPWEFADSPWAGLISGVGPRLYELEEKLNADRYPFADRERRDPVRIVGMTGQALYMFRELHAAVANLVCRFDAILQHYQVEEEISGQKDPSLLWWSWGIEEIEAWKLERLDGAADALEGILNEEDSQEFLDRCRPEGVLSLWPEEDAVEEQSQEAGGTLDEAGHGKEEQHPPRPGFLGLILDENNYTVTRAGYSPVSFGTDGIPWKLLKALLKKKQDWYRKTDLAHDVWDPLGIDSAAGPNAVEAQISIIRKKLKPIEVGIETRKNTGYRLQDLGPEGV
jgi:hypothetical protein